MPQSLGQRLAERALAEAPTQTPLSALLAVKGHYDFAVQGGVVGPIGLTDDTPIPDGATIVGGFVHVTKTVTGGAGSTLAIAVESAGDCITANAVANWTAGAILNVLPALDSGDGTAGKAVVTTAMRDIALVIGTDPLTDGKFDVYLFVIVP